MNLTNRLVWKISINSDLLFLTLIKQHLVCKLSTFAFGYFLQKAHNTDVWCLLCDELQKTKDWKEMLKNQQNVAKLFRKKLMYLVKLLFLHNFVVYCSALGSIYFKSLCSLYSMGWGVLWSGIQNLIDFWLK